MARILIAEHNETTKGYLHAALKKAGNQVDIVDNCLDAWRLSAVEPYDILMIDVVMPGIDSFVLAQRALQENPDVQVIFITGFAGVAMDTYATPSYAPAPLTSQPFHLRDIVSRVRYLMGLGYLPERGLPAAQDGASNVVYADFAHKPQAAAQHLV
jgi:two-component system cell cycle response regulator CpdR